MSRQPKASSLSCPRRGLRLPSPVIGSGDRLRYRPRFAVPADLRARMVEYKPEMLRLLWIPDGWTRQGWIERLRYMAGVCIHPERAAELRAQAAALEASVR